ncbi:hypothetical protein SAMN05445756_2146 [Kytococcus aerolatus]|uniref:DUF1430 domain-containing protein n=1 Tax=Kytococcus aerolatus TaxID=592308 RepID=A0A212U6U2_9MICO|nr:hypothetical protein [Kytococcus aerolatus]SNC73791.1 hypothetical protein SAMN05445756_2146 [Kytococcus aerolatus]
MYRVVTAVAGVLVAILACLMAWMVTDLHDRTFPVAVGASDRVRLDFAQSQIAEKDQVRQVTEADAAGGWGLVRVLPDPEGERGAQVFVPLNGDLPLDAVPTFGSQPDGRVAGPNHLANSPSGGEYLVQNGDARAEVLAWAQSRGIHVVWSDDTVAQNLQYLWRQPTFLTVCVALSLLAAAVVLLWFAVRSRGRGLRVLAGASTARVNREDLARLALWSVLPGALAIVLLGVVVAVTKGAQFAPYAVGMACVFWGVVMVAMAVAAALTAGLTRPDPGRIARREHPLALLRRPATLLMASSLVLVMLTLPGAVTTLRHAESAADQQAFWYQLEDEVRVRFAVGGEGDFQDAMPAFGRVVADAEADGEAAMSYALPGEEYGLDEHSRVELANDRWRDLVRANDPSAAWSEEAGIPASVERRLEPDLDLWTDGAVPPGEATGRFAVTSPSGGVPVLEAGSGDLEHPDRVVSLEAGPVSETYNANFLISVASSGNLLFHDVDTTGQRLRDAGLPAGVQVIRVAEDGILRAEMSRYLVVLNLAAVAALGAALLISSALSAVIAALLAARRDHVLQVRGRSPWAIALARSLPGWVVTAGVIGVAVLLNREAWLVPVIAGAVCAALLPLVHHRAVAWVFSRSLQRAV